MGPEPRVAGDKFNVAFTRRAAAPALQDHFRVRQESIERDHRCSPALKLSKRAHHGFVRRVVLYRTKNCFLSPHFF